MGRGGGKGLQEEIQDAGKPQAGRYDCGEHQMARLKVLSAENGARPHRTVPALG